MHQELHSNAPSLRNKWLARFVPLLLASASLAQGAQSVTLSWNPNSESNIAGYRIRYGTSAGSYTQVMDAGKTTSATISTLTSGSTYYFVATAYNTSGDESMPSNPPVVYTAPATSGTAPLRIESAQMLPNSTMQITITGPAGQNVIVSWSADLVKWTPFLNTVNTSGTMSVVDSSVAGVGQRFYRVTSGSLTSDASGYTRLRVAPAVGKTPSLSYLGIPMLATISYSGTVSGKASGSITDASAIWTNNQFNGSNGDFFLEITSGPNAGLMTDILSTNAYTKTIATDDDLSGLLAGGETYRIRKHRTIGDVFGPNNEAGLNGSTTVTGADEIQLFNPVTQSFLVYYYQTTGAGGTGWRSSTNSTADASKTKLYMDQGVVVKRKSTTAVKVVVTGAVKTGPTMVPVGSGSNLIANMYPAGTLTLANSGIYTGNATTGIASGTGANGADEVRLWSGTAFARYYYKTGAGWRLSGGSTDAGATQIASSSSLYVTREKGRLPFNWKIPQPF